jgi:hypothetical protein
MRIACGVKIIPFAIRAKVIVATIRTEQFAWRLALILLDSVTTLGAVCYVEFTGRNRLRDFVRIGAFFR